MSHDYKPPTRNGFGGSGGSGGAPDDVITHKGKVYHRIQTHHELTCPDLFLLVHSKTRIPLAVSSLCTDVCLPTFTTKDRADEFLGDARKADPRDLTNFETVELRWQRVREIAAMAKLVMVIDYPLLKEGERP